MSIQAVAWAFRQKIKLAALKFVLVALADCANEKEGMHLWPSIAHICDVTGLDAKTVKRYLVELKRLHLLVDTGKRKGRTNQIKVYMLDFQNRSENGSVKEAHISRERGPKTDHVKEPKNGPRNSYSRTLNEPASRQSNEKKIEPAEIHDEILPARWQDLAEARKIPDDQIFRSWRRFKDVSAFPYRIENWQAWIARERTGDVAESRSKEFGYAEETRVANGRPG